MDFGDVAGGYSAAARVGSLVCLDRPVQQRNSQIKRLVRSELGRFGSRVAHPRNADRKIRGSAMGLRWTRNRTSRLTVVSAVLLVMKKTGLGESVRSPLSNERGAGRNGISTTAF